ncbi:MAG: hypothetical protein KIT37_12200 [Steroidobacteraceae bacterium]|nr:hypothetical protein [Steroidobacteraceae bacterium]
MRAKGSNRRSRKQRPLLEIRKPARVRVYRGKFTPFESTKYLDVKALKRAKKAAIECGTVEAAGLRQTVMAEIVKGRVVALKPVACEGCNPKPRKSKKPGRAELRKLMVQVRKGLADQGINVRPKPVPLRISPRLGFQIPIGPIIIVIGDPSPWGVDICFEWWDGNTLCWWCIFGASGCITFG